MITKKKKTSKRSNYPRLSPFVVIKSLHTNDETSKSVRKIQWFLSLSTSLCLRSETGDIDAVLIERYNTPGFIGCLSRVQFNGVAPLKSALRTAVQAQATQTASQPDRPPTPTLPVSYQGKLVESNCGASPLTIPPMSAATDPWRLDNTGED